MPRSIIEEKRRFLSITAYGLHSSYIKGIKRLFEKEWGTKCIFIYEYFLDHPYVRNRKNELPLSVYAPFILRILSEERFIPEVKEGITNYLQVRLKPNTFENLLEFWKYGVKGVCASSVEDTIIGRRILEVWKGKIPDKELEEFPGRLKYEDGIVYGNAIIGMDYFREEFLKYIRIFDKETYIGILKDYLTVVYPMLFLKGEYLYNMFFSISTENIYYGSISILYPGKEEDVEGIFRTQEEKGESETAKEIKRIIKEEYAPILLLFENYWQEKMLDEALEENPSWENCIFLEESLKNSKDPMEKALHELWVARKEFCERFRPKQKMVQVMRKSNLVFAKYLIASVSVLKELKKIIVPRKSVSERHYLPSYLVIGGPGSGKDRLAQMIPLFYPEYRFGKRYIINMASLKPDYLSVPLMSGGDLEWVRFTEGNKINGRLMLRGIFERIWKEFRKEYPGVRTLKEAKEMGVLPTVILDELNSLDIDAQGALLRVLENKSLQPLGAIDDAEVEFLVIGIVNEPEDIPVSYTHLTLPTKA